MRLNSKFLRLPQVIDRTGYRKTAIYERIQQGDFPRPVKLGPRAVGWLDSEVEEWMRSRLKARDAEKSYEGIFASLLARICKQRKTSGNAMSLATLLYLKANKKGSPGSRMMRFALIFTGRSSLSRARNILAKGLIKGPKSLRNQTRSGLSCCRKTQPTSCGKVHRPVAENRRN